jgi:hypothetical protein
MALSLTGGGDISRSISSALSAAAVNRRVLLDLKMFGMDIRLQWNKNQPYCVSDGGKILIEVRNFLFLRQS